MELLLLYSSFLLLLLCSSQGLGSTPLQGTELHHQLKEPAPEVKVETTEVAATMSAVMIGSRPPRCEGRCALCGRCEAVQVPVAPRDKNGAVAAAAGSHFRLSRAFGGDGVDESSTNYKPLNWKCRCADRRVRTP